jgi:hypothetical protein
LVAADQSLVPRLAEISRLFDELSPAARNELRDTPRCWSLQWNRCGNQQDGC